MQCVITIELVHVLIGILLYNDQFKDYNNICLKNSYEKKIRDSTEDRLPIEDYETFQIVKK